MTDVAQEISKDYDYDFDPMSDEVVAINTLERELNQLIDTGIAIESYGMNPTAHAIMRTTGLLDGTSIGTLATESFRFDGPTDPESMMALEAMMDKAKEKLAQWSAKVLTFVTGMVDKTLGALSSIWEKVSQSAKALSEKAWDKAKVAEQTIKAHPYKTVAAAAVAAVAVAAVVALVASGMPGSYANESALKTFLYHVKDAVDKVHWPFGKIVTSVNGSKIVCNIQAGETLAKASASAESMGWGQTAAKSVSGQMSKVWSSLKTGVSAMGGKVKTGLQTINNNGGGSMGDLVGNKVAEKTKSKLVGWAASEGVKRVYGIALWGVIGVITKLLHDVVIKAFRIVKETFQALRGVTTAEA